MVELGRMNQNNRQNSSVRYVKFSGERRLVRDRWYTIDEVAAMFRVTARSVARWLASGELMAYKLGKSGIVRIRGSAIMSFLRPVKVQAVKRKVRKKGDLRRAYIERKG